jgi:steroid delta-isomerase-like uncharacterized protein
MSDLDTFAREMFATVDTHDLEAVKARLAPDCEFSAPGFTATGAENVIAFMGPFLAAFPDIAHEVLSTVEAGDTVALELAITGTHTEPLAGPGGALPPTGRRMDLRAANVWRVADGRIASYHVYFDTGTLMAQLGVGGG